MALSVRLRLRGSRCFDHLYQRGRVYHGKWMVLRVAPEKPQCLKYSIRTLHPSPFRCSVVVSTKVSKSSVKRNALRRVFHRYLQEVLLQSCSAFIRPVKKPLGHWLLLSLKPGCLEIDCNLLQQDCLSLLTKAEFQP